MADKEFAAGSKKNQVVNFNPDQVQQMLDAADEELEAHRLDAEDDRGHLEKDQSNKSPNVLARAMLDANRADKEAKSSGVSEPVEVRAES